MKINELLEKYDAKFRIGNYGEICEINPNILKTAKIVKNNEKEFILHNKFEDELFEVIIKPDNIVLYNTYDNKGELIGYHHYSYSGIERSH